MEKKDFSIDGEILLVISIPPENNGSIFDFLILVESRHKERRYNNSNQHGARERRKPECRLRVYTRYVSRERKTDGFEASAPRAR